MTKTNKHLFLLAFLVLINPLWQVNPYYGHRQVVVTLACFVMFWFISRQDWRRWILIVIVLAGAIVSIETYAQWLGDSLVFRRISYICSTIGNSNYLSAYLLFPIFACISLRGYWLTFLLVLGPALIISGGRAGWIGFAVGIGLYSWLAWPKYRVRLSIWGATCILCVGVALTTYKPDVFKTDSLRCRIKYWQAAWEIIRDNPLVGIGFDGYRSEVYEAQAKIIERNPSWWTDWYDKKPRRVHNMYLEALVDGGAVYFIVLFSFIWSIMRRGWRDTAIFCGLVATLIDGLFFFIAKNLVTWLYFWVFLALLNKGKEE